MENQYTAYEIILAIKKLQENNGKSPKDGKSSDPIMEIVTPQWYYSSSYEVFNDVELTWENLDRFNLVHDIANNIHKVDIKLMIKGNFEKSFASWYQSYHYSPLKWGIHVRMAALVMIAARFNRRCPSLVFKPVNSVKAAFFYLFNHTLFHHITENASSMMELISSDPNIYGRYLCNVYTQVFNSSNCIEESLANSYLFQRAKQSHISTKYLKAELLGQGAGYEEFVKYLCLDFQKGNRVLLSQIREGNINPSSAEPLEQIMNIPDSQISRGYRIPVWIHEQANPAKGF